MYLYVIVLVFCSVSSLLHLSQASIHCEDQPKKLEDMTTQEVREELAKYEIKNQNLKKELAIEEEKFQRTLKLIKFALRQADDIYKLESQKIKVFENNLTKTKDEEDKLNKDIELQKLVNRTLVLKIQNIRKDIETMENLRQSGKLKQCLELVENNGLQQRSLGAQPSKNNTAILLEVLLLQELKNKLTFAKQEYKMFCKRVQEIKAINNNSIKEFHYLVTQKEHSLLKLKLRENQMAAALAIELKKKEELREQVNIIKEMNKKSKEIVNQLIQEKKKYIKDYLCYKKLSNIASGEQQLHENQIKNKTNTTK